MEITELEKFFHLLLYMKYIFENKRKMHRFITYLFHRNVVVENERVANILANFSIFDVGPKGSKFCKFFIVIGQSFNFMSVLTFCYHSKLFLFHLRNLAAQVTMPI